MYILILIPFAQIISIRFCEIDCRFLNAIFTLLYLLSYGSGVSFCMIKDTHQSLDRFCPRLYFRPACPAVEAAPEDPEEALHPLRYRE